MKLKFRCDCPITSSLDIFGDKWMLVLVKLMLINHKRTFKDFIESEEGIATNILSSKLKFLEETEIITKTKLPDNKKTNIYKLTDKGLDLASAIVEIGSWGLKYLADEKKDSLKEGDINLFDDKENLINTLKHKYKVEMAM